MTYDEFFARYNGFGIDYDHYYGDQCMDLILLYSDEVGLPRFWGNAADVADQYPNGWLHVSVPQRGDVVVFARNAANGYAGHIAIYDRPGYYFSQNYPTGTVSHLQYINEPIIAILRPLGGNLPYSDEQYNALLYKQRVASIEVAKLGYRTMLIREPSGEELDPYRDLFPEDILKAIASSAEYRQAWHTWYPGEYPDSEIDKKVSYHAITAQELLPVYKEKLAGGDKSAQQKIDSIERIIHA